MLRDLYVTEVLHKHRQKELHQVTLHAWKYLKNKNKLEWSFSTSIFRPKQSVYCEPCC